MNRFAQIVAAFLLISSSAVTLSPTPVAAQSEAETGACRHYVPAAGTTIAVPCTPTAVTEPAKTIAATPVDCRHYVPSAGITITVPCETATVSAAPAQTTESVAPAATPAPVAVEAPTPAQPTVGTSAPVSVKPALTAQPSVAKPAQAAEATNRRRSDRDRCTTLRERAQLEDASRSDLKNIANACPSQG